nr:MAG: wsv427-like protein [Metapenaeopsis lamellata majanivirus]
MNEKQQRLDTYGNRTNHISNMVSELNYILENKISIESISLHDKISLKTDIAKINNPSKQISQKYYKLENDLSLGNTPIIDMVEYLTPLKNTIDFRKHQYLDDMGNLKKHIKMNNVLDVIWRDVINFSFKGSSDDIKQVITKRLCNFWKDLLKEINKFKISDKRIPSVVILINVIEKFLNTSIQYAQHFLKDALLCRLIRGSMYSLRNESSNIPVMTVMKYIPLCNNTNINITLSPNNKENNFSDAQIVEARIKGVFVYSDHNPQHEIDENIIKYDICSDYKIKLILEFLLSPHIHPSWREMYFLKFISFMPILIRNHESTIIDLSKQVVSNKSSCNENKDYFKENITFMKKHVGCHPFIFLPIAAEFWNFCKNNSPIYNMRYVLINARPSSFPSICGGPAGIAQGKQLAWETYCELYNISNNSCECKICNKRKYLVDRVRQRIGHISGCDKITNVNHWHQGNILMLTLYPFTALLTHRNYALNMDSKMDFFNHLIMAIEKSHHAQNYTIVKCIDQDTTNILHAITFGVDNEFQYKLKGLQKKVIFRVASVDDDILEGDNISQTQLLALRDKRASSFHCWFNNYDK